MMIGWDLGGAHLKAACLDRSGRVLRLVHRPCPLWRGLEQLDRAVSSALGELPASPLWHGLTMTGELVDLFPDRHSGVCALLDVFERHVSADRVCVYAGAAGLVSISAARDLASEVASANWRVAAAAVAARAGDGLLVDVGSTTIDVVPLAGGEVVARGGNDHQRLTCEELVYSGVVRTPVMALARRVPIGGEWVGVMAEHFATAADVYRLTGQLPAHADQHATADGAGKSVRESARRLARSVGLDTHGTAEADWPRLACYLSECQLWHLHEACARSLSRGVLDSAAPLIGAGVGRFLVVELARRMGRPYLDAAALWQADCSGAFDVADCLPAVAVASLVGSRDAGIRGAHPNRRSTLTPGS